MNNQVATPNFIEHFICLANSRKHSGRCIAGKRMSDGSWVRVIGTGQGHEITEEDRRFQNGASAQVLDALTVPCHQAVPNGFQSENILINPRFYWGSTGRASWQEVVALATDQDLWIDGDSAYNCKNNRISEHQISQVTTSLRLIYLDSVTLQAGPKAPEFNNHKFTVRASFVFNGHHYKLDVTDPIYEGQCMQQGPGEYSGGPAVLCVSLSEMHRANETQPAYAYKLVASILMEDDV